jgi:hypothetical protein
MVLMTRAAMILSAVLFSSGCLVDIGEDRAGSGRDPLREFDGCLIGGCGGELCGDEPLFSTCLYRETDACYQLAICERQAAGKCGWTQNAALGACLGHHESDGGAAPPPCLRTGCSGQLCSDQEQATTCEWKEQYACYQSAACERQSDGQCGFTPTADLTACLGQNDTDGGVAPAPCVRTGCSGHVCSDQELTTTCEWQDEYACYQNATCERQPDGQCGFTVDDALTSCLANP